MPSVQKKENLKPIVAHCDKTLRLDVIGDYDGAHNGLQVENSGHITRIAAAVDASLATVQMAAEAKADLLLVHHGLFWSPQQPWTGPKRALIGELVKNNLAVYSSHLPLEPDSTTLFEPDPNPGSKSTHLMIRQHLEQKWVELGRFPRDSQ